MTFATSFSTNVYSEPRAAALELTCPINSAVTLRSAVDNGADWIYLDYCEEGAPNALTGLRFNNPTLARGIRYAHDRRCKVVLGLNAFDAPHDWGKWRKVISAAAQIGIDAIELSDPSLLLYAAAEYPELHRHFRIQNSALSWETIAFVHKQFGISRIVLPRVLTLAQVAQIAKNTSVDLQVISFGKLSMLVGDSNAALASPYASDMHACQATTDATDCCAIVEAAANDSCYAFDNRSDISALKLLARLTALGVRAITVEAQDLGPSHLAKITRVWREAVDECLENLEHYSVRPSWVTELSKASKDRRAG